MSLDFHGAALLAFARQQKMPMQSVLTLGRLDSLVTAEWNAHLASTYGQPLDGVDCEREPYAEAFFRKLGAERVESLDMSEYQGCSVCHDLNLPLPEDPTRPTYDLVFDGGTLEHVFHFPTAIANCMSLVKVGGHFMAATPADHWLGHGFYQFSPELFFRVFAPENGFEMVRLFLAENVDAPGRLFRVTDPAQTGSRTLFDTTRPLSLLVWAKKIADVKPFQRWPQQSDYSARWQRNDEASQAGTASTSNALRKLAKSLLPKSFVQSVQRRAEWQKHLAAASRGIYEMPFLQ
jgi:SAM-dependent methyltransferase